MDHGLNHFFSQHPDVVHEGLRSLLAMMKRHHAIIFGINVSQPHRGKTVGIFSNQKLLDILHGCEARSDISDETLKTVFKLKVHTSQFLEVLQRMLFNKRYPQRELLWAVLDEIEAELAPVIAEWSEVAASKRLQECSGMEEANLIPTDVLLKVKTTGGVGIEALLILEDTLKKPGGPTPRLLFLVEWAQSVANSCRNRVFLLGLLFSPTFLIARLASYSDQQAFLVDVMQAVLDLNRLQSFGKPLLRTLAEVILDLTPQTPNSSVAWLQALQISVLGDQDSADQDDEDLIEMAMDQLIPAIRWAAGRPGWSGFIFQAFSFLTQLQEKGLCVEIETCRRLAITVQEGVADEFQAHSQAQVFLSSVKQTK